LKRFERPGPDLYLDAAAEAFQNRHQSISRESSEGRVLDTGEIGCGEACSGMCGSDRQILAVKRLDDFGR